MNGPSLQRLTLLSVIFHITFLLVTMIALRHSSRFAMPSPYTVSLVSSAGSPVDERTSQPHPQEQAPEKAPVREPRETTHKAKTVDKPKISDKREEQHLSDRIAALQAKKKIEDIVRLRNVISLKGTGSEGKAQPVKGTGGKPGGSIMDDYYAKITKEIWQNWVFPDIGDKNLEAIIAIRILKDGTVQIGKIEKSSGNALFDRTALKAVTKASPLTPPPYEMEVGIRFYP